MWSIDVLVEQQELCFDYIAFSNDSESIVRQAEEDFCSVQQQADNVDREVQAFNRQLPERAREILSARKAELLAQSQLLAGLGVPLRRPHSVPGTLSIPTVSRKVAIKPQVKTEPFVPEPTMEESTYQGDSCSNQRHWCGDGAPSQHFRGKGRRNSSRSPSDGARSELPKRYG
jgi:hypothetical protein